MHICSGQGHGRDSVDNGPQTRVDEVFVSYGVSQRLYNDQDELLPPPQTISVQTYLRLCFWISLPV
jgi:hypothetical protein